MTSRLDRLFVLLDTGSSPVTRKAAALQLGEVQKFHPHELQNLLSKVHTYLQSSQWETRIAAGLAIEAISSNVPQWDPPGLVVSKDVPVTDIEMPSMAGRMTFGKFDIRRILSNGFRLLASEGKEFEHEEESATVDSKQNLAKQRQLLNKRLGFDMAEQIGFDTSDLYSNDDLVINEKKTAQPYEISKKSFSEVIKNEMTHARTGLSSREMNKAKRKAKLLAKQKSKEQQEAMTSASSSVDDDTDEPEPKRKRSGSFIREQSPFAEDSETLDNDNLVLAACEELCEWPFESFCDRLGQDLFNTSWEVRHGAAVALREIVRIHGKGAGKTIDCLKSQLEVLNKCWLEDLALRLLCVLALDRFGDFISDQVVAPVRETCAQTLAVVLNLMNRDSVNSVTKILLDLLQQKEWEARHGGLLGMKYLLAVRKEMTSELLPVVFLPIFNGLQDAVDDVCAVAASALVPVVPDILNTLPEKVPNLVSILWDSLLDQDDLTTSTNSLIILLADLLSCSSSNQFFSGESLHQLIPRLWPFLDHSSSSVRKGALQALKTLTSASSLSKSWFCPILSDALRHVFQRCILEHVPQILDLISVVWKQLLLLATPDILLVSSCPFLSTWLCLMMQPSKAPYLPEMLIEAKHKANDKHIRIRHASSDLTCKEPVERAYMAGAESINESAIDREHCVVRTRCLAAKLLGTLTALIIHKPPMEIPENNVETPADSFAKLLLFHLNSKSALQRLAVGLVITEWTRENQQSFQAFENIKTILLQSLGENIFYDEIMLMFTKMQQECRDFIVALTQNNLQVTSVQSLGAIITMDQAIELCTTTFETLIANSDIKAKPLEILKRKRQSVHQTVIQTCQEQQTWNIEVQATLAGAIVQSHMLPEKLNPVIKPLMDSIQKEENEIMQHRAALSISNLLQLCVDRSVCPNGKIIKNLCTFLTCDPGFTPRISLNSTPAQSDDDNKSFAMFNNYSGILTLVTLQKNAEKKVIRRTNTGQRGRPPNVDADVEVSAIDDKTQRLNELKRRGAAFTLIETAKLVGADLPQKIPKLWEVMLETLTEKMNPESLDVSKLTDNDVLAQDLVHCLQVYETVGPYIHESLHSEIILRLPHLCTCLNHPYTAVRHMGARVLGMLSKIFTIDTMTIVIDTVLPFLGAMEKDDDRRRQGGIEAIANIIDNLAFDLVPYIILLVVPVLGRMSDPDHHVRLMATHCFATLVRLMSLEGGFKNQPVLPNDLVEKKHKERRFLEQLLDVKKLDTYKIPSFIQAELRAYQHDGVNWLSFLNRYKLHGILCDDMGLGKTLQSICILAGDHLQREKEYKKTKNCEWSPLPSLVVCPPTLTGHWVYEVEKFVPSKYLQPLHYTGPPAERQRLRSKAKKHNLIIASYDIVRNDIDFFSNIRFNYCILDEGHIIKNEKTKLSRAIKKLVANHRLILSGTPIQNNVLELWSLFDFLMPGFLGTEKQFMARYSKPILLSRDAKSSSKEQEAGALAMESLHRQVLPFLLRRVKDDVLQDLPPKIIQDYYCELSPLQERLYEDFSKSRAKQNIDEVIMQEKVKTADTSHVFQALQYLRKVCNHPKLVLVPTHPEFEKITTYLREEKLSLSDIRHAAKLPALKQLLIDCGIGLEATSDVSSHVVNQHRVLIFCQLKSMLDILEEDLFKVHMPNVSYLRLDGSVPAGQRCTVVHQFNSDPSIDVLLLTTQVGGLGLNLTGADTVIFVEHDWNPMKDLQAMDRAHRIGQKKVVNVYRLVTKATLEEKIMGLQKFKLTIANTVISQENTSLASMGTDQLLNLFDLNDQPGTSIKLQSNPGLRKESLSRILESLPELWDETHYDAEYDLSNFLQNLRK